MGRRSVRPTFRGSAILGTSMRRRLRRPLRAALPAKVSALPDEVWCTANLTFCQLGGVFLQLRPLAVGNHGLIVTFQHHQGPKPPMWREALLIYNVARVNPKSGNCR